VKPKGGAGRKFQTGRVPKLEMSGEPPAQPKPERDAAGCGPPLRPGTARTKGRGDPLVMKVKALRTAGPTIRTRRFGTLEGGASSTRKSESHSGESAPDLEEQYFADRWSVEYHSRLTPGTGPGRTAPRRKPVVSSRPRPLYAKASQQGDRRQTGFVKAKTDPTEGGVRQFRGDAPHPETGRHRRQPSDGRKRVSSRATGQESRALKPVPVCAGIAVRRPARVVDGIRNRAGNSPSGERKEPGPDLGKRHATLRDG